ncbi:glycoside hydrolase family 108 protein [uncultured Sphingomonas sp.]|uniref:glycoside hydrolase family 108 protein n=1 Tax=uncultured Sphingomonas sp. TaxID=158754 RepID=UPI0035CAA328
MPGDLATLIDDVIDREGGFVDDPADPGGATCWGVTRAVARANGYAGDMRAYPRAAAVDVYRRLYWLAPGFDRVATRAPHLAADLFDTAVNMGAAVATGFLQRALNALNRGGRDYPDRPVDGKITPRTLAALDAFLAHRAPGGEAVLVKAIEALQGERYLTLAEHRPADEAFLYGWLANRIG